MTWWCQGLTSDCQPQSSEFKKQWNVCINLSAYKLKPLPTLKIKLWNCEEYQRSQLPTPNTLNNGSGPTNSRVALKAIANDDPIMGVTESAPVGSSTPQQIYALLLQTEARKTNRIWGTAGKSLVRPGRKQATATKLRIYSTYSPQSSIHFLAHCFNFCKPLKKKIRKLSIQPGLRGNNDLRARQKMATFQLFFQSREKVVVRREQIRRIGWVIKTLEAPEDQFLLGCKCPAGQGIVVQEQDPLGDLTAASFLQMSFNCTSREE